MSSAPPMLPLQSVLPSGVQHSAPGPHCWNRNHKSWIVATAPWGDEEPREWLGRHPARLLYSARGGPVAHPQAMTLEAFDLGGAMSAHERLFVGAFTAEQTDAFDPWSWHFLCTLPGLRHVVEDFEPLLSVSPRRRRVSKRKPVACLTA